MRAAAIVGAGPAGLGAALELARAGHPALVLEADPVQVGGLSRTMEWKGYRFDIGGHRFFTYNPEIEALWRETLGEDLLEVRRVSRILYRGRFFDYPLRLGCALPGLGLGEALRCLASFALARLLPRRPVRSFEDWVVNAFGHRLYEIFFRSYTEKVWGMPCREISSDWASQRIRGFDLWQALRDALRGREDQPLAKTLTRRFLYPRLGPGMMWEALAARVESMGVPVRRGCRVVGLRLGPSGVEAVALETPQGPAEVPVSHVVSSMPLPLVLQGLDPAPPEEVLRDARSLGHRDFLSVLLVVDRPEVCPDQWIYVHDPGVRVGRVQNFKNWSAGMVPDPRRSSLGLEYFCTRGDEVWSLPDGRLVDLGIREACQIGLVRRAEVVEGTVVRAPWAYPVYDRGYTGRVERIRRYLEARVPNLHLVGRNGMHRYFNQDHAMWTGMQVARRIVGQEAVDPWQTNAREEYLEGERQVPLPA